MAGRARKAFLDAWIDDAKEDYQRYGAKSLLPTTAFACIILGLSVALLAPHETFFRKPDTSLFFLTAILTFDGLLLTLSWNGFAKIYEIASRPKFSAFLRRVNMIEDYFFQVDFIHFAQIVAVVSTAIAMSVAVLDKPPMLALQLTTASCIATSAYALKNALGAIRLMQDLVYYSSIFEEQMESTRRLSRDANDEDPERQVH